MSTRRTIVLIALSLLLASCAVKSPMRPPAPDYLGPLSAEAFRERIAFANIPGMRSEITATIYRGDKKLRTLEGALVMRMPGDMRIVLYDPFGNTAVDIVISLGKLEALVPSEGTIYYGPASSLVPPEGAELRLRQGEERHILEALVDGQVVRRYSFEPRTALNTGLLASEPNMPSYEAFFRGHTGTLPGAMTLRYADAFSLDMVFKDAVVEQDRESLPDRLFPLGRNAAHGMSIEELELR